MFPSDLRAPPPAARAAAGTRPRSWSIAVLILGVTAFAGRPARSAAAAEPELYVSLDYQVDASMQRCWSEPEFQRSVARRVGYDPFRDDAPIRVLVRISGTPRAVDGHVIWRNAQDEGMGERRFGAQDDNCVKLLTEMSFAVGLQIELLRPMARGLAEVAPTEMTRAGPGPAAAAAVLAPTPAPDRTAPPITTPTATPQVSSPSPPKSEAPALEKAENPRDDALVSQPVVPPESSRWPMWLGIGPSLALGIAPSTTGTARLFFGVRREYLSAEVGAEASYPSTRRQGDGSGFRVSLIGASAAFCGHRGIVSACALGKASQLRVTGLGVEQQRSPVGFVAQVGLRLAAAFPLGGAWFATAHLDALGLLTPCGIDVNRVRMWDMPRLAALAGIDVSARFR